MSATKAMAGMAGWCTASAHSSFHCERALQRGRGEDRGAIGPPLWAPPTRLRWRTLRHDANPYDFLSRGDRGVQTLWGLVVVPEAYRGMENEEMPGRRRGSTSGEGLAALVADSPMRFDLRHPKTRHGMVLPSPYQV